MTFCGKCGAEIAEGNGFCTNCGYPIAAEKENVDPTPPTVKPVETEAKETPSPSERSSAKEEALKKYEFEMKKEEVLEENIEICKKKMKEYKGYVIASAVMSIVTIAAWFILLTTVNIGYTVDMGGAGNPEGSATLWEMMTNNKYGGSAVAILWIATVLGAIFSLLGILAGAAVYTILGFVIMFAMIPGFDINGSLFDVPYTLTAHLIGSGIVSIFAITLGIVVVSIIGMIPLIIYEQKLKKEVGIEAISKSMKTTDELFSNVTLLFK